MNGQHANCANLASNEGKMTHRWEENSGTCATIFACATISENTVLRFFSRKYSQHRIFGHLSYMDI